MGKPGTMRLPDGRALEVLVLDLTRDGCRIETAAVMDPDLDVEIGLAGVGRTPGRIVWRAPSSYGCVFDAPLPPGAITAAFQPSNLAILPGAPAPTSAKVEPRATLLLIVAGIVASWTAVTAIAAAILR